MAIKSKAQQRLMYASLNKDTGVPKKVAEEYIEATPKDAYAKLKEKLKKPKIV
jgi:hypothetical protein